MTFNNSTNITLSIEDPMTSYSILTTVIPNLLLIYCVFGFIGFLGNAFIFLQPELLFNTCCIYIFCSSIVDVIHLAINVFPDYYQVKYGIRLPWNSSTILCKLFHFLNCLLPQLAVNFLILSIIDRFACTCSLTSRMHRFSQLKILPKIIGMIIFISCIFSIYGPILALYHPSRGCVITNAQAYVILNTFINGIIQPLVMLVFVLLTFRNIRLSRQRVVS